MIRKILIGFIIASLAILLLLWLFTGGTRKIADAARSVGAFWGGLWAGTGEGGGQFRLPWQPEGLALDQKFIDDINASWGEGEKNTSEDELRAAESEYETIREDIEEAKTFGEPSPYRGQIYLASGGAADEGVAREYVEVEAVSSNSAPVGLIGWSLQSALTGIRGFIPGGAELFVLGEVNPESGIYLNPGATAVISSGASPVGTSFRENICTGYLGGLQSFVPPLSRACPAPSDSMPGTAENLAAYGDECYDLVHSLPACAPPSMIPSDISSQCRNFLANTISYNGCLREYRYKTDFIRNSWRIYLGARGELWRNTHDIIRLLDAEGRTVDVVSY